ncbi:hypothetical protein BDV98DRAFT_562083 [Pterulicium gracile]|uniref:Rad60/SUMO-like domain-containing protein n=1 Tax=Pterulicium gracile TaxID=1884261 RepID=A0A5C3QVF0_9AGAR|nr:hypothetical protein BDV98DRAFT_562083 [Pterula gracilis]
MCIKFKPQTRFRKLRDVISARLSWDHHDFILYFVGRPLLLDDTPWSLDDDMADGDTIDVIRVQRFG